MNTTPHRIRGRHRGRRPAGYRGVRRHPDHAENARDAGVFALAVAGLASIAGLVAVTFPF